MRLSFDSKSPDTEGLFLGAVFPVESGQEEEQFNGGSFMTVVTFHAELPQGADARQVAAEVQERLAALTEINEAVAAPDSTRFAAEMIAGIAITVAIIKGAGQIADALHDAIPKIKLVLQDLGLTNARVEVAGELVPIDDMDRSRIRKISAS